MMQDETLGGDTLFLFGDDLEGKELVPQVMEFCL